MSSSITPDALARWRRALHEEGDGEWLDPTLAQQIAPVLIDEVERLHAEIARLRAAVGLSPPRAEASHGAEPA